MYNNANLHEQINIMVSFCNKSCFQVLYLKLALYFLFHLTKEGEGYRSSQIIKLVLFNSSYFKIYFFNFLALKKTVN